MHGVDGTTPGQLTRRQGEKKGSNEEHKKVDEKEPKRGKGMLFSCRARESHMNELHSTATNFPQEYCASIILARKGVRNLKELQPNNMHAHLQVIHIPCVQHDVNEYVVAFSSSFFLFPLPVYFLVSFSFFPVSRYARSKPLP